MIAGITVSRHTDTAACRLRLVSCLTVQRDDDGGRRSLVQHITAVRDGVWCRRQSTDRIQQQQQCGVKRQSLCRMSSSNTWPSIPVSGRRWVAHRLSRL